MTLWALLVFNCTDMNTCVAGKTYYQTQQECEVAGHRTLGKLVSETNDKQYVLICRKVD